MSILIIDERPDEAIAVLTLNRPSKDDNNRDLPIH
jgi:hypothetical protein